MLALEKHADILDKNKVCVEGGSHGGFLTAWLIGHPKYKHLWRAAVLWNAVLNMSYSIISSDIPDWVVACCQNKELTYGISAEDNTDFFNRSP
mmetsp:Transcript_26546/g.18829  ORF Transcript_26546/g.18829 Transcript_26546/m.18829 type:complete len:93 (+) Transcript_26546:1354-1632(+)